MNKNEQKALNEYLIHLGERIRELRKAAGMTQVEMAKQLDTQHPQIGRLERGEANSTIGMMAKVASVLGVSLKDLLKE